jgi:hypothetical protein
MRNNRTRAVPRFVAYDCRLYWANSWTMSGEDASPTVATYGGAKTRLNQRWGIRRNNSEDLRGPQLPRLSANTTNCQLP